MPCLGDGIVAERLVMEAWMFPNWAEASKRSIVSTKKINMTSKSCWSWCGCCRYRVWQISKLRPPCFRRKFPSFREKISDHFVTLRDETYATKDVDFVFPSSHLVKETTAAWDSRCCHPTFAEMEEVKNPHLRGAILFPWSNATTCQIDFPIMENSGGIGQRFR
jgi:hypothetical protein